MRLAVPRRVYTLSQIRYALDGSRWLYENRERIGGYRFNDEPNMLRFFSKLEAVSGGQERLIAKYNADFGGSL